MTLASDISKDHVSAHVFGLDDHSAPGLIVRCRGGLDLNADANNLSHASGPVLSNRLWWTKSPTSGCTLR
jgi:hypothetical protein